MRLVVDASVAVKWILPDRHNEQFVEQAKSLAAAIERSGTTLFAPSHWVPEVISVIVRAEPQNGRIRGTISG